MGPVAMYLRPMISSTTVPRGCSSLSSTQPTMHHRASWRRMDMLFLDTPSSAEGYLELAPSTGLGALNSTLVPGFHRTPKLRMSILGNPTPSAYSPCGIMLPGRVAAGSHHTSFARPCTACSTCLHSAVPASSGRSSGPAGIGGCGSGPPPSHRLVHGSAGTTPCGRATAAKNGPASEPCAKTSISVRLSSCGVKAKRARCVGTFQLRRPARGGLAREVGAKTCSADHCTPPRAWTRRRASCARPCRPTA